MRAPDPLASAVTAPNRPRRPIPAEARAPLEPPTMTVEAKRHRKAAHCPGVTLHLRRYNPRSVKNAATAFLSCKHPQRRKYRQADWQRSLIRAGNGRRGLPDRYLVGVTPWGCETYSVLRPAWEHRHRPAVLRRALRGDFQLPYGAPWVVNQARELLGRYPYTPRPGQLQTLPAMRISRLIDVPSRPAAEGLRHAEPERRWQTQLTGPLDRTNRRRLPLMRR